MDKTPDPGSEGGGLVPPRAGHWRAQTELEIRGTLRRAVRVIGEAGVRLRR